MFLLNWGTCCGSDPGGELQNAEHILTGIVPTPKAFGLSQGFHVPIHVALGALLLGGDDDVLVLHVRPPGDVLRGAAGDGLL